MAEMLDGEHEHDDQQQPAEVGKGEEAIELLNKEGTPEMEQLPDFILIDINMPKMNGIEATTRIHGQSPHLPIIGLSVNGIEHGNAILRAGAKAFVSKEAAVDRLYVAILNAVNCS